MTVDKELCEKYKSGEYSLIDLAYFTKSSVATISKALKAAGYEVRGAGRRKANIPDEMLEKYHSRTLTMAQAAELCDISIAAFSHHYHDWKGRNGL